MTKNKEIVEGKIEWAEVAYGDSASETAQNLIAAVERLGLPRGLVKTTSRGVFRVPAEVAADAESYAEAGKDPDALDDLKADQLDELAEAEDIDLAGAKKSKVTRIQRIEEVRAERAAEKAAAEAAAESDPDDDEQDDTEDEE